MSFPPIEVIPMKGWDSVLQEISFLWLKRGDFPDGGDKSFGQLFKLVDIYDKSSKGK